MKKFNFILIALLIASPAFAQTCQPIPSSKKCVDFTPCKQMGENIACLEGAPAPSGAVIIPKTCWQFNSDYACSDGQNIDTCSQYAKNASCSISGSRCTDTLPETGLCSQYVNTFDCITSPAKKEDKVVCSNGLFDDSSFATPQNKNGNFAKAAVAQEMLRQAATYGKDGRGIFAGVFETCTKGYAGIKNCCKAAPGAQSNSTMATLAMSGGVAAVKYVGATAVDVASPYVFDAMFAGGEFMSGLAWDMATSSTSTVFDFASNSPVGTDFAAGGPSLGAYGFTFQSGIATQGSGLFGANSTLATFGEGQFSVTFNPYVFAAVIVIQVIQELAACSDSERMLAMHKGSNLSVYSQTECTQNVLGKCVLWKEKYCSFNSVLSKIINTQGKPQLNLPIDSCEGFSVEEISKLDFTKIDFSEFSGEMTKQANKNIPTNMKTNYTPVMQNQLSGTAQGTSPVIPKYNK